MPTPARSRTRFTGGQAAQPARARGFQQPAESAPDPLFKLVVVSGRFDAADDWIVEQATPEDIAITSDIPLADRCLKKGAPVLDPKGRVFSEDSIGDALASRELSAYLRDMGELGGGPKPYTPADRSRFLGALENQIQALLKAQRLL